MRGVAVLCVMVGHEMLSSYPDPTGGPHVFAGWLAPFGVVIFFTISGFLLYRQFLAARFADEGVGELTPAYLWRRAVRILPAYWVALTLGSLWVGWEGAFSDHWWVYYGLLQSYSTSWLAFGLPIAWSLCIEATFYLSLPLIALLLARRGLGSGNRHALRWELGVLGALAIAGLVWRVVWAGSGILNANLMGTISWFALGMLLASMQVAHPEALATLRRRLASPWLCWPLAAVLFAALFHGVSEHGTTPATGTLIQTTFYGFAAALLLAPAVLGDTGAAVRRVLANRTMVFVGTISYGVYLWHYTVLAWLDNSSVVVTSRSHVLTLVALVTGTTSVLATASWYLVEKPLMRRAKSVKAFRHVRRGKIEVAQDESPGRPPEFPPPAPAGGDLIGEAEPATNPGA